MMLLDARFWTAKSMTLSFKSMLIALQQQCFNQQNWQPWGLKITEIHLTRCKTINYKTRSFWAYLRLVAYLLINIASTARCLSRKKMDDAGVRRPSSAMRSSTIPHGTQIAEDRWNAAPSFNEGSLLKKSIPFFVSTTNLPLCTLFNYLPLK